jgi:two-component system, cell cycle response regulator
MADGADKKKKLLFVDDEAMVVKIMSKRLQSKNYEVVTALSGQEAIDKAKSEKPNVIVLDQGMPGMSGTEACKKLKADPDTKEIPIFMFTALERFGLEEECMAAGAIGVFYKPTISDLLEKLNELFGGEDVRMDDDPYA